MLVRRGVACSALYIEGVSKNSANILVVSANFVKSVGAVFHPVWGSRKVAVASWLFKADAGACCFTLRMRLSS